MQLIIKQLRGEISIIETLELKDWMDRTPENREFLEKYGDPALFEEYLGMALKMDNEALDEKVHLRIERGRRNAWDQKIRLTFTIAAVLAVTMILPWLLLRHTRAANNSLVDLPAIGSDTTVEEAFLTLPDGKIVPVGRAAEGTIISNKTWTAVKTDHSTVVFLTAPGADDVNNNTHPHYCVFWVPYRQCWNIVLPDGSKIRLNAGSTLGFEIGSAVTNHERIVYLSGEAFFELGRHLSPFIVRTRTSEIYALSTSFDVRDYASRDGFKTTLVSGKILLHFRSHVFAMNPGQEARVDTGTKKMCRIRMADTALSMEWRSSVFNFTNRNIQQVMQQIVDWYGLRTYIVKGNINILTPGLLGWGHVSKDIPLKLLIRSLDRGKIGFQIFNRTVIITSKS